MSGAGRAPRQTDSQASDLRPKESTQELLMRTQGVAVDKNIKVLAPSINVLKGRAHELVFMTFLGGVLGLLIGSILSITVYKHDSESKSDYMTRTNNTCPPECLTNPNCKSPTLVSHICYYTIVGMLSGLTLFLLGFSVYILVVQLKFIVQSEKDAQRLVKAISKVNSNIVDPKAPKRARKSSED